MSGTAWFHIAFGILVVVILLIVWAALVLEASPGPSAREPQTSTQPEGKP